MARRAIRGGHPVVDVVVRYFAMGQRDIQAIYRLVRR
jgi:hypothetical protein